MNIPTKRRIDPVGTRLLNQQLVKPKFSRPEDLVAFMGAVQAQEYRLMRWAISMRTKRPSAESFRRAYDSGRILRLHLMRGTWQLIAAEDYVWMMGLFSSKAITVINGWMHANGIHIPDDEYVAIRSILLRTTHELGSATAEDYAAALTAHGITMDKHRLSYHIRMAELLGYLCNGDLLPMKASYSLVDEKVFHLSGTSVSENAWTGKNEVNQAGINPAGINLAAENRMNPALSERIASVFRDAGLSFRDAALSSRDAALSSRDAGLSSRDAALSTLTRKYLQSRSPATLEDFVWWSGLGIGDCKRGIELLGDEVISMSVDGADITNGKHSEYYLLKGCRISYETAGNAITGVPDGESLISDVLFIPPYDEYLIGYKSRHLVLNPEHSHFAHNNSGNFSPIIAVGGRICGNWSPFDKENPKPEFFENVVDAHNNHPDTLTAGLDAEWKRYRQFQEKIWLTSKTVG